MNVSYLKKSVPSDLQSNCPPQDTTAPANEATRAEPLAASAGRETKRAIEQAVVELLNDVRPENEKRWEPRVPFVRPVSICFKHWREATEEELAKLENWQSTFREFQTEIAAISTDISLDGVSIVAMYDALPSHVTLELDGTVFACEVCWSESIDAIHYRYGLRFQTILDKSGEVV